MIDKQEAGAPAALEVTRAGRSLAAVALALALAACTAVSEMTQSPEQAEAETPQRVTTEGAKDKFPNLSTVPDEAPASLAPEERERIIMEMQQDRERATFSEPPPLVTAAGGGQLAAIIFFGHGSSDLDARDRSVLRDVAALHQQRGGRLRIVGHASSRTRNTTPDEHQIANFDMSLVRAEAVQAELLALGVAVEAMTAEALGDAEPVYHEFMPSGEAGNRRVEIFLEN